MDFAEKFYKDRHRYTKGMQTARLHTCIQPGLFQYLIVITYMEATRRMNNLYMF